jgi:CheY-like chemotaxis protein
MPNSDPMARPFAYVIVVEADDAVRDLILQTVRAPNCAVDVARDEDEAVAKSLQHRPRLVIVKQHSPIHLDELHPPSVSIASRICRRARLSRAVRLVTHSDAAMTLKWHNWPSVRRFSDSRFWVIARPVFDTQPWRNEWYSYSTSDMALKFLSVHLRFWLGAAQPAPSLGIIRIPGSLPLLPWARPVEVSLN